MRKTYEQYEAQVAKALESLGLQIISVHRGNAIDIIKNADAIFVGGGNTFELVNQLYNNNLVELIAKKSK